MAKIIDSLPAILQTPALKNFFEGTAEQLFSKANTISVNGYVGNQTGEEYNVGRHCLKCAEVEELEFRDYDDSDWNCDLGELLKRVFLNLAVTMCKKWILETL